MPTQQPEVDGGIGHASFASVLLRKAGYQRRKVSKLGKGWHPAGRRARVRGDRT